MTILRTQECVIIFIPPFSVTHPNCISYHVFSLNKPLFGTVFKFNNDGNKIEESRYDSDGVLEWKSKYTYDEKGNKTENKELVVKL